MWLGSLRAFLSRERDSLLRCIIPKGENMRFLSASLLLILLLTACVSPAQPNVTPVDTGAPALDGTFESSLLVTEWKGNSEGNILFPFDPLHREALSGYDPISLDRKSTRLNSSHSS